MDSKYWIPDIGLRILEYEYWITLEKSPFLNGLAYLLRKNPNMDLMNKAAEILFQYHDFQCFSRTKTDVKTYHCTIKKANWEQKGSKLVFTIAADRFLRNMVRAIVGTMLEIGYEKMTLEDFHTVIQQQLLFMLKKIYIFQ